MRENIVGIFKNVYSIIAIILIVLMLVFMFRDVGGERINDIPVPQLTKTVAEAAGMSDKEKSSNRMVKHFYGLNPNDYGEAVYYAPETNMDVDELFIIKVNDINDIPVIEEAIQQHLDTQLTSFEGYGINQTALLNASRQVTKGKYVMFVCGEKAIEAAAVFNDEL